MKKKVGVGSSLRGGGGGGGKRIEVIVKMQEKKSRYCAPPEIRSLFVHYMKKSEGEELARINGCDRRIEN